MKIVQNALFRSCGARFSRIAFVSVKVLKIVTLAWNSCRNGKTVRFRWKLYKRLFSGHAQHVLAKSHFWASKFSKSSPNRENSALLIIVQNALFRSCAARFGSHFWASKFSKSPEILAKTGKQCAFHENCTKRSFQVMRSTFWPNRIFERQSSQNRHTGLKFSPNGKTVRFRWKLYKTLFSGHAQHVLAKSHFWASKFSKSQNWPQILFKTVKQCAFHENCTKRSFQVMRSTLRPNRILERQSSQNRKTGLKFPPNRENSALYITIVQNALFRLCAARFAQIAFLSVKVLKIVTSAWNSRQKGKTVRFPWKLYQTLFTGHAQHVLAKSHWWVSKFSKSSPWPISILAKEGKQCAFHENCTKRSFQVMCSTFWPNRIFERQSSQNRHFGQKFSSKKQNSAILMKSLQNDLFRSCRERFGQIAFVSVKVLKIATLAWNSRQNGKTERFMKLVQNALFKSCAARFGQIAFVSVKVLKIVKLAQNSLQNGKTVRLPWKVPFYYNFHQKILQNALFRSCGARFGQIAFVSVKVLKIVTLAWNSLQKGKTGRFS